MCIQYRKKFIGMNAIQMLLMLTLTLLQIPKMNLIDTEVKMGPGQPHQATQGMLHDSCLNALCIVVCVSREKLLVRRCKFAISLSSQIPVSIPCLGVVLLSGTLYLKGNKLTTNP